jgi:Predicted membrane protein
MKVLSFMEHINDFMGDFLLCNAEFFIHVLEIVGMFFIVVAAGKSIYEFFTKNNRYRLDLAEGLATGLEFKLGGEILRTVIVRDFEEIGLVGGIIILRVALTVLIHWEIKNEEKHIEKQIKETTKQYVSIMKDKAIDNKDSVFLSGLEETIHESAMQYFKDKTENYLNNVDDYEE